MRMKKKIEFLDNAKKQVGFKLPIKFKNYQKIVLLVRKFESVTIFERLVFHYPKIRINA